MAVAFFSPYLTLAPVLISGWLCCAMRVHAK